MKKRHTEKTDSLSMKKMLFSLASMIYTSGIICFCLILTTSVSAQIVLVPDADHTNIQQIIDCTDTTPQIFTDDGMATGLYTDTIARVDTIIICPTDSLLNYVRVTFNDFDMSPGDTLTVYDCNILTAPCVPKEKASGPSASSAFGGWVQANCARTINSSGCLTFVISTNGDNNKGKGWEGLITCESDKLEMECPDDVSVTGECNNLDGLVSVNIPKPEITSCDGNPAPMVKLRSLCSIIPDVTVIADGSSLGEFNLPIGRHTIVATAVADTNIICSYDVIVDQPSIACNNRIILGGAFECPSIIKVDDILESPCVGPGITYMIEMDLGPKNGGLVAADIDGSSLASIEANGLDFSLTPTSCQEEYPVKVTRILNATTCADFPFTSSTTCNSIVRISDNLPEVRVHTGAIVACNRITDEELKSRLNLVFSCNTDPESAEVAISRFSNNLCGTAGVVDFSVTVSSYCGETVTNTFTIGVNRPSSFFPPADATFSCSSDLDPEMTGFPLIDTDGDNIGDLEADNDCDYLSIFEDRNMVDPLTNRRSVLRIWTIIDRCNLVEDVVLAPQVITISDGKPIFDCASGTSSGSEMRPIIIYTENDLCEAHVKLTPPTVIDSCIGTLTINEIRTINKITNNVYPPTEHRLAVGQYYTQYVAVNDTTGIISDTCRVYFSVTQPGGIDAICVDEINAAYSTDGFVKILAEGIDVSGDNACTVYKREIRKENGEWGESVKLSCSEVADSIELELRITDSNGAFNICTAHVTGKDTAPPICSDLEDMEFVCDDFQALDFGKPTDANLNREFDDEEWQKLTPDLLDRYDELFGSPSCTDNLQECFEPILLQQYQLIPASCGQTKIKRRFTAFDEIGNFTEFQEQLITVTFDQNFTVNFPADWEGTCGSDFPEADLDFIVQGCTSLGWTHEDKRFDNISGACYLLERTYFVTNWCSYETNGAVIPVSREEDEQGFSTGKTVTQETMANVGQFIYTQILKVSNSDAPVVSVEIIEECLTGENCGQERTFSASAEDCSGEEGLDYSYELLKDDNIVISGEGKSFTTFVNQGVYQVKWGVNDNCGNVAWETIDYNFVDCKAPTIFCLDGIAVNIGLDKEAAIWATDLNQKSSDNCTPEDQLELRVWHHSLDGSIPKPSSLDEANEVLALPQNITLDCDYLGTQAVELYVVDALGNWDFCIASVDVQDLSNICNPEIDNNTETDNDTESVDDTEMEDDSEMATITGQILDREGTPIEKVLLSVQDGVNSSQTYTTDELGQYTMALPKTNSYTISFEKEGSPTNGVTTFDLVLISKHILGITSFDNPYKYFAADVNQSSSITAFDMVIIRQIILGIKPDFGDHDNWQFLDATHRFATENPMNENVARSITISTLTEDMQNMNFVAVKTGDIDGSVNLNDFSSASSRNTIDDLTINIENRSIKKGALVEVDIEIDDLEYLQGFQYKLDFTDLELIDVKNGQIDASVFTKKSARNIAFCWNQFGDHKYNDDPLLTLVLQVNQDGLLSDFLQLSTQFESEAVDTENNFLNIQLNFGETDLIETKLLQNTPNPFKETTTIGFQLAQSGPIVFEIFNLQGRLLKTINGYFERGNHEIKINKEELQSNGILWYKLQSRDGIYTRKMLLLK